MSDNVTQALQDLMTIDGSIAAALVDFESGMTLGQAGGGDHFNIDVAAAGNTQVVRAKMSVMQNLGLDTNIEDILITLGSQYHIIRPLESSPSLFLYAALDRQKANLGMARHQMSRVEKKLDV